MRRNDKNGTRERERRRGREGIEGRRQDCMWDRGARTRTKKRDREGRQNSKGGRTEEIGMDDEDGREERGEGWIRKVEGERSFTMQ